MENWKDTRKVCIHITDSEIGGVPFIRYFTGKGIEYFLACEKCFVENEIIFENLREILVGDFDKFDKVLFTSIGIKGSPQIKTKASNIRFEHNMVTIDNKISESLLDIQPLESDSGCNLVAITKSLRILKIDLNNGKHYELCKVSEDTKISIQEEVSIQLSKNGKFCSIVNTKGQHGLVVDIYSGKIMLLLDRGNYHNEVSIFPVAFIGWDDKTLIIHGTAWNTLDISDVLTGKILTKGEFVSKVEVVNGTYTKTESDLDYFHSSISVSNNCEWIVDNGWIWHPFGSVVSWNVKKWIEENVWEFKDGSSKKDLCERNYYWDGSVCWLNDNKVAVYGIGDDGDLIVPGVRIFDVLYGTEVDCFAGPDNWLVFDKYLFSADVEDGTKVWDVNSGEMLHNDKSFCPTLYHKCANIFISKISSNEYKLSKLV